MPKKEILKTKQNKMKNKNSKEKKKKRKKEKRNEEERETKVDPGLRKNSGVNKFAGAFCFMPAPASYR